MSFNQSIHKEEISFGLTVNLRQKRDSHVLSEEQEKEVMWEEHNMTQILNVFGIIFTGQYKSVCR